MEDQIRHFYNGCSNLGARQCVLWENVTCEECLSYRNGNGESDFWTDNSAVYHSRLKKVLDEIHNT